MLEFLAKKDIGSACEMIRNMVSCSFNQNYDKSHLCFCSGLCSNKVFNRYVLFVFLLN